VKLHAKIKPELLDLILHHEKTIEVRSLETITLTDGKRTHTFVIDDAHMVDSWLWGNTLPQYFDWYRPTIAIRLGEEVKE